MTIRKVLTFRASSIGDALMAKYFLEQIHEKYPNARYGIIVANRGAMIRDLLSAYPWIEVIEANRKSIQSLWHLWKRFHESDIVLTQYAGKGGGAFSMPSKLMARVLAVRGGLVGFIDSSSWNTYLYDTLVPIDIARAPRLLETDALVARGIPIAQSVPTLLSIPHEHIFSTHTITKGEYVVVHLFAGSLGRGMSQEKRQALLDVLADALPERTLIVTGSATECPYLEKLSLPKNAKNLSGKLSLQELITLIRESKGMVSIGTGPSHIASHVGTKVIVLVTCIGVPWCAEDQFGPHAGYIFTRTDLCCGHHDLSRQPPICIEEIDVNNVAKKAKELFS